MTKVHHLVPKVESTEPPEKLAFQSEMKHKGELSGHGWCGESNAQNGLVPRTKHCEGGRGGVGYTEREPSGQRED